MDQYLLSHPRMGESVYQAACRRLQEELGIKTADLEEIQSFVYRYTFENGLTEFEFDHVLAGEYEGRLAQEIERKVETGKIGEMKISCLISKKIRSFIRPGL